MKNSRGEERERGGEEEREGGGGEGRGEGRELLLLQNKKGVNVRGLEWSFHLLLPGQLAFTKQYQAWRRGWFIFFWVAKAGFRSIAPLSTKKIKERTKEPSER